MRSGQGNSKNICSLIVTQEQQKMFLNCIDLSRFLTINCKDKYTADVYNICKSFIDRQCEFCTI